MDYDAVAESWRNPGSKHGRPNPSRETKFSGANGDSGKKINHVQMTPSRIGNHTRLIYLYCTNTLLKVLNDHTCRAGLYRNVVHITTLLIVYNITYSLIVRRSTKYKAVELY